MRRSLLLIALVVAVAAAATAGAQTAPASQIFSARLDGTDERGLSGAEATAGLPVRGPGGRIFFVRGGGGEAEFWVMNEDGSDQRPLGARPGDGYFGPAWSPDGKTVGVTRWDESPCSPTSRNCAESHLVLADAETGAERVVLRPGRRGRGIGSFSWAPNGSRLAYAGELDMDLGARTVETVRADGSGRRVVVRLASGSFPGIGEVAWSPRGDRIAYHRGGWLYVVRAQGGASTRLARGRMPVWSPRGDKLVFRSWRDDSVGVVDVATRRVRVLGRAAEVSSQTWSPDGGRAAFELRTRGVSTVVVVRVADGRRLHSWRPGGDVGSLLFTRDGTRLVYARSAS